MLCAGLTADELVKARADEEFAQYMNGDTGKGDSGKSLFGNWNIFWKPTFLGGPLVCPEIYSKGDQTYDRKVLWGVTSFGTSATDDTIGVYTRVFEEMGWIQENILKEKENKLECQKNKVFCAAQL